jgi:hypothetical protein
MTPFPFSGVLTMPDISINVPYISAVDDDLQYRGPFEPPVELTAEQRLTLLRIQAGMADAGVPLSARRFPDDAIRHLVDLVTAGAP